MRDYAVLDGEITCLRNRLYDEAYKRGYADGLENTAKEFKYEMSNAKCYQRGLEDAWECARDVVDMSEPQLSEDYGLVSLYHVFNEMTADQVMKKIMDYEERQTDEIKVGDEVYDKHNPYPRVVTSINDQDMADLIDARGNSYSDSVFCLIKTGRHFPQIAEVLEQMRKESE